MKIFLSLLMSLLVTGNAWAKIRTEKVKYNHGKRKCVGFLAYDDTTDSKRPGIIIAHQWKGLSKYEKSRAIQLAKLGYVALAIDMYGKGKMAKDHKEAAELSGVYRSNRQLMRSRAYTGLRFLQKNPLVNKDKIAAIGYCFGGTTVIEMARGGENLAGVASFHGILDSPTPEDAKNIKGKVLVLHGVEDPYMKFEVIEDFKNEMINAAVDWKMIFYGGAVHSFTMPGAGDDKSKGSAYNEKADKDSWAELIKFFSEIF